MSLCIHLRYQPGIKFGVELAIEKINSDKSILKDYTIVHEPKDTKCDAGPTIEGNREPLYDRYLDRLPVLVYPYHEVKNIHAGQTIDKWTSLLEHNS